MNVLMIGWELPPHNSGGLGVACLGLAKALANNGSEVTFVLPKKVDLDYDFLNIVFANVKGAKKIKSSYSSLSTKSTYQLLNDLPSDYVLAVLEYGRRVKEIAAKCQADIIHAHDWLTYPAALAAKEVLGVPLVVHIHNTAFDRGGGNCNPYEYAIEKLGFEEADVVLSVSEFTKRILMDKYGIPNEKIKVVHNGIDTFPRKDLPPALTSMKKLGYKIVLFLGRITMHKGPEYFIRAAKRVTEFDKKVLFVVVGSGDKRGEMIVQAANLGISDRVFFTGFLRGEEKDRIYQSADLFVMPSVSEPFGIVSLEAAANGTPVIVSKQSGVSEVLNHALKVDFWDTDEMANQMLAVLNYRSLGSVLRKESARELPSISWDNAADKCLGVYQALIGA